MPPPLNLVIPLAGAGSRFAKQLWHQGKPMIDLAGKPMLIRVIENVYTDLFDVRLHLVSRRSYQMDLEALVSKHRLRNVSITYLDEVLQGTVMTLLTVASAIDGDTPLFVVNSDQVLEFDKGAFYSQMRDAFASKSADGVVREGGRDRLHRAHKGEGGN